MKVLLVCLSFFLMISNIGATRNSVKNEYPIFLGVIEKIEKQEGDKGYRVLVNGYIKGSIIKKEEIVALVSKDTKIEMLGNTNMPISFKKGDNVFIEFSMATTFSIPPQSFARKMTVYRKPLYSMLSDEVLLEAEKVFM